MASCLAFVPSTSRWGVTSVVRRRIKAGSVMETFDFNASVLVAVAVLVSLAKLVHVVFATLKACVREYYAFRVWLRDARASADPKSQK